MCDTLVILKDGATWFAKNSDRQPDEPQLVEAHPPVQGDASAKLAATYIEIDQVPDRHGVIISRPDWMWGAEMGVNDQGVAIGNETVFSTEVDRKNLALLGMDLVRLGLERGGTATKALRVITALLEQYGQAGPGTHRGNPRKGYRYDNSFLIADGTEAWVLETAGRAWAAKRVTDSWAISNAYSIRDDYDLASNDLGSVDLKARFETRLVTWLARGHDRMALSNQAICEATGNNEAPLSLSVLANILRAHHSGDGFSDGFRGGSNKDVCMHAKGLFRPSHTTGSLIASLTPGKPPRVALTGTPSPCISLFKPVGFAAESRLIDRMGSGDLWRWGQSVYGTCVADPGFRARVRTEIAAIETGLLSDGGTADDNGGMVEHWLTKIDGLRHSRNQDS